MRDQIAFLAHRRQRGSGRRDVEVQLPLQVGLLKGPDELDDGVIDPREDRHRVRDRKLELRRTAAGRTSGTDGRLRYAFDKPESLGSSATDRKEEMYFRSAGADHAVTLVC